MENEQEKIEPFDTKTFEREKELRSMYLRFEEKTQKELVITNWVTVWKKFSADDKRPKPLLRMDVLSIDGQPCDPPKVWETGNMKLIEELGVYINEAQQKKKGELYIGVKRGLGTGKATNYTVWALKKGTPAGKADEEATTTTV